MPALKTVLQRSSGLLALPVALLLSGCNTIVLNAPGDVAAQQGKLIIISTVLMLLIIVPVIALTVLFAWRYRAANKTADYRPDWDHSTGLELIIWAAPLLIVIALGAITWISTHTLDPYRPLRRLDTDTAVAPGTKPLTVEVVALDWKWLFIYPELGIATVNELAAPVNMPIRFKITGTTVMNSFFIPALAGQIYAMPGMQTELHAVINSPGEWEGFSANYSGMGFSDMRFKFHGLATADFDKWVAGVKASNRSLARDTFLELDKPSLKVAPQMYGTVAPGLFHRILNRCVADASMCAKQVAAIDAQGVGSAATYRVAKVDGRRYVEALACTVDNPDGSPLPRTDTEQR